MPTLVSMLSETIEKNKSHPSFKTWYDSQKFGEGDLIVINNSFVFRDSNTTKANYYVVLKHGKDKIQNEIYVSRGLNLNSDLVFFSSKHKSPPVLKLVDEAIEEQLSNIGKVIFVLIGNVHDDVILRDAFEKSGFTEIVWNPQSSDPLKINRKEIVIKSPYDEPSLWKDFVSQCRAQNITIDEVGLKKDFGVVLDNLQGKAEARLKLPEISKKDNKGITDTIIEALKERRSDYAKALSKCDGNPEKDKDAFNEVLRISYNFSNDVIPLMKLIISICDLKPIILWLTIGEHYTLSESFRNLPWTRSKFKASLKNYIDTVGDARNSIFHNLFPIQKALRFSLPSEAFQDIELLIFSEYAPRGSKNKLTYQDKELVDLFLKFTRARQRPVPSEFWEKNVDVMDKVIALFEATNQVLKELYRISLSK